MANTKSKIKVTGSVISAPKTAMTPALSKASTTKKAEGDVMDRATLKGIVAQLNNAGSGIKVLKTDTDEQLQGKVNAALQKLPPADVVRKLKAVDPDKLVKVLGRDCMGLFIDLSDVSCVRCVDASSCVAAFIKNVKGFPDLTKAAADETKGPTRVTNKVVPMTRYTPDRLVFVRDVPNPNPEGDDYHDTFARVLGDQPETLGELRAIVESDFDLDNDGDFMKFVTAMRDPKEGIIKLDVDLSESDKKALREAGYEV